MKRSESLCFSCNSEQIKMSLQGKSLQIKLRHNIRFRYDKGLFAAIQGYDKPKHGRRLVVKAKAGPKVERYDKTFEFNQNIKTSFKLPN